MSPSNKICRNELLIILGLVICGFILLIPLMLLAMFLLSRFSDLDSHNPTEDPLVLHSLMWYQAIFIFFLPSYWWCKHRLRREPLQCYGFRTFDYRWVMLAIVTALAFVVAFDPINAAIYNFQYPEALQAILNQSKISDYAMSMTLMNLDGFWGILECVLLASLVTGVVEETMFRGALLKCFGLSTLNRHWIAIIVGAIFSIVHFEFFGALDRFIFGVFACYLVYWSGSIWPSIALHATNNLACIISSQLSETVDPLAPQELTFPWYASVAAVIVLYFVVKKMLSMRIRTTITQPSISFTV